MIMRALAAAMLAMPAAAHAVCDTANTYRFAYATQAAATLAYGGTYSYTATTSGGASHGFTVAIAQNGLTGTTAGGVQMPAIGTLVTGPDATQRDLVLGGTFGGRTASLDGVTRVVSVTFTFTQPIRDFAITVHDVDFAANQFRDWLQVTGANGANGYVPALVTPAGNGNGTGMARTAAGSSITVGTTTTPLALSAQQAAGTGTAGNNSDTGTITASFAQPVTSVTVRYGNHPLTTGELVTGQQAIGIAGISFCPMPAVMVTKTSTPVDAGLGAFDLPSADVVYALTVANSGGSPVDAASIVLTDLLPAGAVFRNLAFDASTASPLRITGGSGLTLSSGGVAYSNDAGASWGYAPAAGYDAAVRGLRVTPQGTLQPGQSATISFIARIR